MTPNSSCSANRRRACSVVSAARPGCRPESGRWLPRPSGDGVPTDEERAARVDPAAAGRLVGTGPGGRVVPSEAGVATGGSMPPLEVEWRVTPSPTSGVRMARPGPVPMEPRPPRRVARAGAREDRGTTAAPQARATIDRHSSARKVRVGSPERVRTRWKSH
jgi:hypothetical protein